MTGTPGFWIAALILGVILVAGLIAVTGLVDPNRLPRFLAFISSSDRRFNIFLVAVGVSIVVWVYICLIELETSVDDPIREQLANDTGYPIEAFPEDLPDDGFFTIRLQDEGTTNVELVVCHYSGDTQELWCTDEGDLELMADPDGQEAAR